MILRKSWEPHVRPIHKLILHVDLLAIAWNRFRQLSFKLYPWDEEKRCLWDRMYREFQEIRALVVGDWSPTIEALALECFAETATWGLANAKDVIREGLQWIGANRMATPARYPSPDADMPCPSDDPEVSYSWNERRKAYQEQFKRFEEQGEGLRQVSTIRGHLLELLADHHEGITDDVRLRHKLYHIALQNPAEEESVCQSVLLAYLGEETIIAKPVPMPESETALPGYDPVNGSFIVGLPSGIDRNSELWNRLPKESKEIVERNDQRCKRRSDLLESSNGRLQLFLEDFRLLRYTMTENGTIDPIRFKIEASCLKWWAEARFHRDAHAPGILSPLPPLPESFENAFRVQNALDALVSWAEDSLKRLGIPTSKDQAAAKGDSGKPRGNRVHDERDKDEILMAWERAKAAGTLKKKFIGDYARERQMARNIAEDMLNAAMKDRSRRK